MFQIDTRKIHSATEALEDCYRKQLRASVELNEVYREMCSDGYFPECADELRILIRDSEEEGERLRAVTETLYAIRSQYLRKEEEIAAFAESGVKAVFGASGGILRPGSLPEGYTKIEIV